MNAVRHGIHGKKIMLKTEEEQRDFRRLEQFSRADLKPDGVSES